MKPPVWVAVKLLNFKLAKDKIIPGKVHMQRQSSQSSGEVQLCLKNAFDLHQCWECTCVIQPDVISVRVQTASVLVVFSK